MSASLEARIEREKTPIHTMIRMFCRGRHGAHDGLCPQCATL